MRCTITKTPRALAVLVVVVIAGCATVTQKAPPRQDVAVSPAATAPAAVAPAAIAPAAAPAATTPPVQAPQAPKEPPPAAQAAAQQAQRPTSITAEALGIYRTPEIARAAPSDIELQVIASAKLLLGKPPNAQVVVSGRKFTLDCIGTVSAIYYRLAIDVTKDFSKYSGNGVNRLYMSLKDQEVLHSDKYPRPGDVIIWDNTWDANGDGDRTNDLRTHAGIVLAVDDDGTISYVHENLLKGVVIEVMNLLQPTARADAAGKTVNSGMAIATKAGGPFPEHWLAGDVFSIFGDVLRLKDYYAVTISAGEEQPEPAQTVVAMVKQD